jgi:hypothetical protein
MYLERRKIPGKRLIQWEKKFLENFGEICDWKLRKEYKETVSMSWNRIYPLFSEGWEVCEYAIFAGARFLRARGQSEWA